MHGLTGGSWKRNHDRPRPRRRTTSQETVRSLSGSMTYQRSTSPRQFPTLHRMSSGSYFPASGAGGGDTEAAWRRGSRVLGVPTVADRVAQTVVASGWRRRSSRSSTGLLRLPSGAVGAGRGWRVPASAVGNGLGDRSGYPEAFFDSVPWDLIVKAVEAPHRRAVGAAVREAVAARADAACPTGP